MKFRIRFFHGNSNSNLLLLPPLPIPFNMLSLNYNHYPARIISFIAICPQAFFAVLTP